MQLNDKERKKKRNRKRCICYFLKLAKKEVLYVVCLLLYSKSQSFLLQNGIVYKEKYKSLNIDAQKANKYERTMYYVR